DRASPDWTAAPLFRLCCRSFLASFKIWNEATVGGNICMSLPAGPMISLTAALEGVCTLWPRSGEPRRVSVCAFVTGNQRDVPRRRTRVAASPQALDALLRGTDSFGTHGLSCVRKGDRTLEFRGPVPFRIEPKNRYELSNQRQILRGGASSRPVLADISAKPW